MARIHPPVLVDMDLVLADIDAGMFKAAMADSVLAPFAQTISTRTTHHWRPEDLVSDPAHKEHIMFRKRAFLQDQDFWENLPPVPGAIHGFHNLWLTANRRGRDLFIVSVPVFDSPISFMSKCRWVRKHLGPEVSKKLILTHDKTIIDGVVLVDDSPIIAGDHEPTWRHVMFRSNHNRDIVAYPDGSPYPVMDNWSSASINKLLEWI